MATSRGYSDRTVTYYINNDLMYGKGSIADLECLNVYFRKVLNSDLQIIRSKIYYQSFSTTRLIIFWY